jgi:hypothetical protein
MLRFSPRKLTSKVDGYRGAAWVFRPKRKRPRFRDMLSGIKSYPVIEA